MHRSETTKRAPAAAALDCLVGPRSGVPDKEERVVLNTDRRTVDLSAFPDLVMIYLGMRVNKPRACYELGRKPHRNADYTVALVLSRSPFPAFLSCF
jgi:hypothetical protein